MITYLGVAIKCTSEHADIPHATRDCEQLYSCIEAAAGRSFSRFHSTILPNVSKDFAMSMIGDRLRQLDRDDLFIFHFTGHGRARGTETVEFLCGDFLRDKDGRGVLNSEELGAALRRGDAAKLVILDCCYSAGAQHMLSPHSIFRGSRISLLAASRASVNIGRDISPFTKAVCEAFMRCGGLLRSFTIGEICDAVNFNGSVRVKSPECDHIVFGQKSEFTSVTERFATDFLKTAARGDTRAREALWYSLHQTPRDLCRQILDLWFRQAERQAEPSWLVRRAIGSVIAGLREFSVSEADEIGVSLLKSTSWMDKCIGLIGLRTALGERDDLLSLVKALLTDAQRADLAWLAYLYLADSSVRCDDLLANSLLFRTAWGIVDCIRRSKGCPQVCDAALTRLHGLPDEEQRLLGRYVHWEPDFDLGRLRDVVADDSCLERSSLARFLRDSTTRGEVHDQQLKWLLSRVYGSWRDQLKTDLGGWLGELRKRVAVSELKEYGPLLPLVEHRMAIFSHFAAQPEFEGDFAGAVRWGLSDPHPWVRREALRAFGSKAKSSFQGISDGLNGSLALYPGVLDLLLLLPVSPADVCRDLTHSECSALTWAHDNECYVWCREAACLRSPATVV